MPANNPAEEKAAEGLRAARRLAGLTQEEAARKLDVSVRTYSRWERADSVGFLRELERIAKAFGTTPDAIIGGQASDDMAARMERMEGELRELRSLLLDPSKLRAAAQALVEDEDV